MIFSILHKTIFNTRLVKKLAKVTLLPAIFSVVVLASNAQAPANDNPCNAIALTPAATCTYQTFTNANATGSTGMAAPGCANYSGGDVWFKAVVPAGGALTFDTDEGVITDGGLAIYRGNSCFALVLLQCDDNSSDNGNMGKVTVTGLVVGSTVYARVWENGNDNNGTFGICVTIPVAAPPNDNPCTAIQLTPGATCVYQTFTNESATSTANQIAPGCANYQGGDVWFKVIVPALGALIFDTQEGVVTDAGMALYRGDACNSVLTLISCDDNSSANGTMPKITAGSLNPGDTVWVRIWESGNDNNGTFGLCVTLPPPPPVNDGPCTAIELPVSTTCTYQPFTNENATATSGPPAPGCANYQGGDVWFRVIVPAGGALTIDTDDGVVTDGGMAIYKGTCNALSLINCDDDASSNGAMPKITAGGLNPGDTLWVRIWEDGNDNNGTFGICVTIPPPAPANDEPCNAIVLTADATCTFQTFTNENATGTTGVPAPGCASYAGGDVWFSVIVPAGGALTFNTQTGVITDGGMAIYKGTCNDLSLIECDDDDSPNGAMPLITAGGLNPGDTIWIRVWEFGGDGNGTFGICVSIPPPAPVNDNPCAAVVLPVEATCNYQVFSNESATGTAGITAPGCAGYSGADVWFAAVVPAGGAIIFDTDEGVMTDGGMALYSGNCGNLALISCDDNSSANGTMPSLGVNSLTPGDTIWVRVWENGNNNNGTFGICAKVPPPPPLNDDPCAAIALPVNPDCVFQTFTNESATATTGVPAPGCAGFTGGDVWFTAVVPAGGAISFDTDEGVITDGGMAIYRGTCNNLTLINCDDNSSLNGNMPKITLGSLTPGDTLWIRVWENGNNESGTFDICASIPPPPPSNDEPCAATELIPAATCTFQEFTNLNATATPGVAAPGCASYVGADVWFKVVVPAGGALNFDSNEGVILDGGMAVYSGTCNNLTLIECDDDDSNNGAMPSITTGGLTPGDTLWVRMWEFGGDNNGTFSICVTIPPPAPSNDNPCNAIELTPAATCTYQTFTNESALGTAGVPAPGCAGYAGGDVWFKTVVPAGGALVFDSQTGVMLDGGMAIYKGTCSSLTLLECDDDDSNNGAMPSITAGGLTPGDTIWVRMWEDGNSNNGTFGICVTIPPAGPANDNPCGAITLTPSATCTYQNFSNAGAINTVGVPAPGCANYQGGDIWFKVTIPSQGGIIVDTREAVMTDGGMALYTGSCDSLTLVSCDDNNSVNGSMPNIYATGLTPGTTAWIRVWENGNDNNGTFDICITIPPPQPATLSVSCIKDTTIGCGTCFSLTTTIPNIHSTTDDYVVNPLSGPGNCFRPYVGPQDVGPSTNLGTDDVYTDVINLPFAFPFYGKNYTALLASTNGFLSFDTTVASDLAGNFSHWQMLEENGAFAFGTSTTATPINLPSQLYDRLLIMGPYHDINPGVTTSPDRKIKYNVTGIAPNRRWVLSFYKVPLYNCNNSFNNTHQIVLYEGSGMIEVFVFDKEICPTWNRGRSIIGLQDSSRTRGIMAPGRRASDPSWGTVGMNESWRFVPIGGTTLFKRVELYDTIGNLLVTGDTSSLDAANLKVNFNNICPAIQTLGVTKYIVRTVYTQFNDPAGEVVSTDTIRVTRNAVLNPVYAVTNSACTATNGSIVVTGNGTSPYSFSSDAGVTFQADSSFINLGAGTYNVVTTDANGCRRDTAIRVTAASPVIASYEISPAICNGANGVAAINILGGASGPFEYSITGGSSYQTDSSFSVPAGMYVLTIKDINNCTKDTVIEILQPDPLAATYTVHPAVCSGNGSIVIDASGGTGGYQYSTDNGITYQAADSFSVAPGTYNVRIKDANNCTKDSSIVVATTSVTLTGTYVVTPASCAGTGTIAITPTSGVLPYQYSSDGGITYQDDSTFALPPGTYVIGFKDARNCVKDTSIEVGINSAPLTGTYIITPASCNGGTGTIAVTPTSGILPYLYSSDGGLTYQNGNSFTLPAGTYNVIFKDFAGCLKDTTIVIAQPAPIMAAYTSTAPLCNGGNNGSIFVSILSGGTSPFEYSSNGGTVYQPDSTLALGAGTYSIRIRDVNGCTKDSSIVVTQPAAITATYIATPAKCNGDANGKIFITATGGTGTYQYSADGGATYQAADSFIVGFGIYNVSIKDANNCTKDTTIEVTQPAVLTASATPGNATCDPVSTGQIVVTAAGGTGTYNYSIDNGLNYQTLNTFNAIQGIYTVTVSDANGCTAATAPATIGFTFNLTLQGRADTSICGNVSVRLNTISNAQTFTWTQAPGSNLDNTSSASPLASPTVSTDYYLTAQTGNCISKDTVHVGVVPIPTVLAGGDVTIVIGADAHLSGSVTNAASYIWSPTTYLDNPNSLTAVSVMPQQNITYTLTATNSLGCSASDEVIVKLDRLCTNIKNAFTPNGDGVNDNWLVYDQFDCLSNVRVQIFNRYGSKVYESTNYRNQWTGTYNGQSLPDATYYYVVDYLFADGRAQQVRGDVTILR